MPVENLPVFFLVDQFDQVGISKFQELIDHCLHFRIRYRYIAGITCKRGVIKHLDIIHSSFQFILAFKFADMEAPLTLDQVCSLEYLFGKLRGAMHIARKSIPKLLKTQLFEKFLVVTDLSLKSIAKSRISW